MSHFTPASVRFFRKLKRNNDRKWFEDHREEYEETVKGPSRAFIEAIRAPLQHHFPGVRVDGRSMFRIHRDIRFSNDKTPYKTWGGFNFKDLRVPNKVGPSIYFGFDPSGLAYGVGLFEFSKLQREHFRNRMTSPPYETSFAKAIAAARKAGFDLEGKDLKRMPIGFDAEHENAEFLLHNGLYAFREEDMPKNFYTPKLADYLVKRMAPCAPLFQWLREMAQSAPRELSQFL